jgi:hypothetical protein
VELKFSELVYGTAEALEHRAFAGPFRDIPVARWPSGKAKVCKTLIGGSIPLRASRIFMFASQLFMRRANFSRISALEMS